MGCKLEWVREFGRRKWRRMLWKMRAEMKRGIKKARKRRPMFHYDPSSYALNFDDGCCSQRDSKMLSA
ncbi:hypothetical protein QJS10_CPB21g00703 [Acorus calamus]|uniref:Uncharacterized protein n=1 Tax=Acorus calamus TaxID=4465 RepID=A0AAV9C6C3_ACOCL|nr:hypothetical protein QJS10_CPB21g00703 [Acorus calamus]